jgi:signal peptidase I
MRPGFPCPGDSPGTIFFGADVRNGMQPTATTPLTDQLANINPLWIVGIVTLFTIVRITLARAQQQPWARTVSETCDTINFVLILAFLLVRPFVAQAFYIPSESMENTLLRHDRLIVDKFSYRLHDPARRDVMVFNAPPEATDEGVEGIDFIKRIIAVPGDTIEVRPPQLRIGGDVIDAASSGFPGLHDYLRSRLELTSEDSVKLFPDHVLVNGSRRIAKAQLADLMGRAGAPITITPGQTLVNDQVQDEPYTREDPDYRLEPVHLSAGQFYMLGDNRNRSRDSHVWGPLPRSRVVGRAIVVFWPIPRAGAIR